MLTEEAALSHLTQLAEAEGQSALARRLGVSPALMSHILSGKQGIGKKLAHALGWQLTLTRTYTEVANG